MVYGITATSESLGINPVLFFLALVWILIWKGLALWKSARKNQLVWFIVLLIINTLGILEILYIFLFSKIKLEPEKRTKKRKK